MDSRLFCATEGSSCSLDRTGVRSCELSGAVTDPPAVYAGYTTSKRLGLAPEMDYCPHYAVPLSNRNCSSTASITVPYSNVNFMREVFSSASRCLMSTLHADAPAPDGGA